MASLLYLWTLTEVPMMGRLLEIENQGMLIRTRELRDRCHIFPVISLLVQLDVNRPQSCTYIYELLNL
jgi:hypothetical protein